MGGEVGGVMCVFGERCINKCLHLSISVHSFGNETSVLLVSFPDH